MTGSRINYQLIAVELGEAVKWDTSLSEIDRLAAALFPVPRVSHPTPNITSVRASQVYDWVLSVSDSTSLTETEKAEQVGEFASTLLREGSPVLRRIRRRLHATQAPSIGEGLWAFLHPWLAYRIRGKFDAGHFADAVESALKEVNVRVKRLVKEATGKELDGAALMNTAFSPDRPLLVVAEGSSEKDRNAQQQGYMQLFAGTMTGIRNPLAHSNIEMTREEAVHLLFLASLLLSKLDQVSVSTASRAVSDTR
jgi:uncharacterized protein (TIGR02391 family)